MSENMELLPYLGLIGLLIARVDRYVYWGPFACLLILLRLTAMARRWGWWPADAVRPRRGMRRQLLGNDKLVLHCSSPALRVYHVYSNSDISDLKGRK